MPTTRLVLHTPVWNRFRPLQLLVMAVATIPTLIIGGAVLAATADLLDRERMIDIALAAGENPGTFIFGMMFLATPVQWLTGRSQVRVRKYLGMVFYTLAVSNFAMFVLEEGLGASLSEPFLVAGSAAVLLATPLFLTSSRGSQRFLGMRRWRLLHRLTYVIAVLLVAHVALIGEVGFGSALIALGFIARIPAVRRRLGRRGSGRRGSGRRGSGRRSAVNRSVGDRGQLEEILIPGESLGCLGLGDSERNDLVGDTLVLGDSGGAR